MWKVAKQWVYLAKYGYETEVEAKVLTWEAVESDSSNSIF